MKDYVEIDGLRVDHKVLTAKFSCDYEKCKGACCNKPIPDVELNGAILSDYEAADILYHRKNLASLCDDAVRIIVLANPVTKIEGNFFTSLSKDKCVLCSMQRGGCVIKIAKQHKIADIDLPLSCQLYPIFWEVHPTYERIFVEDIYEKDYCVHGYEKGERDNVYLIDFLKEPLIRAFGEEFYSKLKQKQKELIG